MSLLPPTLINHSLGGELVHDHTTNVQIATNSPDVSEELHPQQDPAIANNEANGSNMTLEADSPTASNPGSVPL
jgi:hypothetical protein